MTIHPPGNNQFKASAVMLLADSPEINKPELYKTEVALLSAKRVPNTDLSVYALSLKLKAPWQIYSQLHDDAQGALMEFWDALKENAQAGVIYTSDAAGKLVSLSNRTDLDLLVGLGAKSVPPRIKDSAWLNADENFDFLVADSSLEDALSPFSKHNFFSHPDHAVNKLLVAGRGEDFIIKKA